MKMKTLINNNDNVLFGLQKIIHKLFRSVEITTN